MARIRTIKPAFFLNEQVAALSYEWRLLFIGLWTQADREGRLEDRPLRLKAGLFPYDGIDMEAGLARLQSAGLIVRYEVGGQRIIAIPTWSKHQQPHIREAASELPSQDEPGEHQSSTVLAPVEPVGKGREQERKEYSLTPPAVDSEVATTRPSASQLTAARVVSIWNETTTSPIPKVTKLTGDRRRKVDDRIKEYPSEDVWLTVIGWIETQAWCRAPGRGEHPNWTATLDWLCKSDGCFQQQLERAQSAVPLVRRLERTTSAPVQTDYTPAVRARLAGAGS